MFSKKGTHQWLFGCWLMCVTRRLAGLVGRLVAALVGRLLAGFQYSGPDMDV
jgi:hypothetical protein